MKKKAQTILIYSYIFITKLNVFICLKSNKTSKTNFSCLKNAWFASKYFKNRLHWDFSNKWMLRADLVQSEKYLFAYSVNEK